jgi:glucokinase
MESRMAAVRPILLADIGGTNARFALLRDEICGPIEHIRVAEHSTAKHAIAAFLGRQASGVPVDTAILAVAGVIDHEHCEIINSGWILDAAELRTAFDLRAVHLLNDFEALAWSVPHLKPTDLFELRRGRAVANAPVLLIGPGTGFGASCLLSPEDGGRIIASEAAHSTLPAASPLEDAVIDLLRRRFGHASVERALSGPGLQNLYEALAAIRGTETPAPDAAAITTAALEGRCELCRATLDMFCALLGEVAGNLALTFCARGGVYIGGGIVTHFPEYLARSGFGTRFSAKGRFHDYLRNIPVRVITRPDATFAGLKAFADHRARCGDDDYASA